MPVVPLRAPTHSVVPLKAAVVRTWLLSDRQEQVCWVVQEAPIEARLQTSRTHVTGVSAASDWQAPHPTSLLPVPPSDLDKEGLDPRSLFAEVPSIRTTQYLPSVLMVLNQQRQQWGLWRRKAK